MRSLIAAAALAAAALAGCTSAHAAPKPAVCHFDGGGSITAGNAARTTEGTVWECTEDGRLIRIR